MIRHILMTLGRAILVVVVVASAWYTAVSLYWWEWQRAMFLGLLCLGSLVLTLFLLTQRRLDRIEQALHSPGDRTSTPYAHDEASIPSTPQRSFGWLGTGDRTYVFIPFLVGFGLVVSAVAVLIERVAGFVVGSNPAAGRRDWRPGDVEPWSHEDRAGPRRVLTAAAVVILIVAIALLGAPLVGDLVYEPGEAQQGQRVMELQVRGKRVELDPVATASTVADVCRTQTGVAVQVAAVTRIDEDTVRLVIEPRLHSDDQRRFAGCLTDLGLDRHHIRVTSVMDAADQPLAEAFMGSVASRDTST